MRENDSGAGHRLARLQGILLEELRGLVRDDLEDPALADVWVNAVVLSVDYRNARVHFGLRVDVSRAAHAKRGLERATPFIRARLADAVDLKRVPDLRFVFDGLATEADEPGNAAKDDACFE